MFSARAGDSARKIEAGRGCAALILRRPSLSSSAPSTTFVSPHSGACARQFLPGRDRLVEAISLRFQSSVRIVSNVKGGSSHWGVGLIYTRLSSRLLPNIRQRTSIHRHAPNPSMRFTVAWNPWTWHAKVEGSE